MIIETKVYNCRKCQSEDLVKNGTNASGSSQYHCKACGAYGVLERKERATEENFQFERWNNTLRKQLAHFVRKMLSFSKCVRMYEICLKLFMRRYDTELLPIVG